MSQVVKTLTKRTAISFGLIAPLCSAVWVASNLSSRVEANSSRLERHDRLIEENSREVMNYLRSIDRRLSVIEGAMSK